MRTSPRHLWAGSQSCALFVCIFPFILEAFFVWPTQRDIRYREKND